MYDTEHDAQLRLGDSVIRYRDRLVRVTEVSGVNRLGHPTVNLTRLEDGHIHTNVDVFDEALNYTPIPLGYVNCYGHALYLSRMPQRRWRQGLTAESLAVTPRINRVVNTNELLRSRILQWVVDNTYPTIKGALETIDNLQARTVAISRQFAIGQEKTLFFRGSSYPIGGLVEGVPRFNRGYQYLREMFEGQTNAG